MSMRIFDQAKVSSRKRTRDGYLIADAALSRTGTQDYSPSELIGGGIEVPSHLVGKPKVTLNRPEEEVFAPDAMAALAHLPLTIGHPREDVTPENVQALQVGFTMDPVQKKGSNVTAPVMVQAAEAIDMVENGRDQLSVGYDVDVKFLPEEEAKIKGYDGFMTSIIPNHIALVDQARGGENVRIMDKQGEINMEKRIIDGVSYEFPPQSAQAVDKLQTSLSDAKSAHEAEIKTLKDEKSALEGELDTTKKELETAKSERLSDEDVSKLVDEKASLVEVAKKFVKDHDGLSKRSPIEIKRAVVLSVHDGMDLEGKDDTYVQAAYDTVILNSSDAQSLADSIEDSKTTDGVSDSTKARKEMIARRGSRKA